VQEEPLPPGEPRPSLSLVIAGLRDADASFARAKASSTLDARLHEIARAPAVPATGPGAALRVAVGAAVVTGAVVLAAWALRPSLTAPAAPPTTIAATTATPSPTSSSTPVAPAAAPVDPTGDAPAAPPALDVAPPTKATSARPPRRAPPRFDLTAEIRAAEDLAHAGRSDEADARLRLLLPRTDDTRTRVALAAERVVLRAQGKAARATVCALVAEYRAIAGTLDDDIREIARTHDCPGPP
jgi:hypothetical protein